MPVVRLNGLYVDGSEPAPDVARNPAVALKVIQGSTTKVKLVVVNSAGELVDLSTATLALTVKRENIGIFGSQASLSVTGVSTPEEGAGRALFEILPTQTYLLEPGVFAYDIWMVLGGDREPLIPTSPFHLEPSVQVI